MNRLIQASAFGIVICGVVFGFVVGSRIDQSTITLLSGTLVGIAVATPCVAVITWLAMRKKDDELRSRERMMRQGSPLPSEPPQYWVVPAPPRVGIQAGMQAGQIVPYDPSALMPRPRRRFYVIGENGEPREVRDPTAGTGPAFEGDYPPAF